MQRLVVSKLSSTSVPFMSRHGMLGCCKGQNGNKSTLTAWARSKDMTYLNAEKTSRATTGRELGQQNLITIRCNGNKMQWETWETNERS